MSDEDYGADLPQDRSHSSGDNNNDDSDEEEGFYVPTAIIAK